MRGFRVATLDEVVEFGRPGLRQRKLLAPIMGAALPLSNNGAGGTAGTTVSTTNSGAASGNAWDTVSIGTSEADTYDDTFNVIAGEHMQKLTTATTLVANYVSWTTSLGTLTTNQTLSGRLYYVPYGTPSNSSVRFLHIMNGTTVLCGISHNSGVGDVIVRVSGDTAASTSGGETTTALTANTLYRIEFVFTGIGTSAGGAFTVKVFSGNSTTQVGVTATLSAQNFGTLAPTAVQWGFTTANGDASKVIYIGSILLNTTGVLPGPDTGGGGTAATPTRPLVISQAVQRAAVR